LELIRKFSGCIDEHGFINVHVAMVRHSKHLVTSAVEAINAVSANNRLEFNNALNNYKNTMREINSTMETMWSRSQPNKYLGFRTFIMGTKNQPMFPNGIIFEGSIDVTPRFYRGESGANDSMIPLSDNLFGLTDLMPRNTLTDTLKDSRSYRPVNHTYFLKHVETEAREIGLSSYASQNSNSAALLLANLDQIRDFRNRHWMFTKNYIIKYSEHPTATGGSPIVTWLPNQLRTVLEAMDDLVTKIKMEELTNEHKKCVSEIAIRARAQHRTLIREVEQLKLKFVKGKTPQ